MVRRLHVVISHLHLSVDELEVFFLSMFSEYKEKNPEPRGSKSWRRVDKEAQKAGWYPQKDRLGWSGSSEDKYAFTPFP